MDWHRRISRLTVVILSLFVALVPAISASAAEKPPAGDRFKISLDSHASIGQGEKAIVVDAITDFVYAWTTLDRERTLSLNSMRVKALVNGKVNMDAITDRDHMVAIDAAGNKTEIKAVDAPVEAREMMEGIFSTPICTITLDDQGQEAKRQPTTRPAAQELIRSGIVGNCTLFHPPTALAGRDQFRYSMEIGTGNGVASGPVKYVKAADTKAGQIRYTFSGAMESKQVKVPGKPVTIQNAKYDVTGEETYDEARKQWLTGSMKVELTGQILVGNNPPQDMKGIISVKFELIP